MKIKSNFVSNSSSTSFVVIATDGPFYKLKPTEGYTYYIGTNGKKEFGLKEEDIRDIHSRINFAAMQAEYVDKDEWLTMLYDVIRENSQIVDVINLLQVCDNDDVDEGFIEGYIDHQSASYEGRNTEMFNSKELLRDFIFRKNSYIHTDNDNH